MIERTPGQGPYARPERERRWLLRRVPDDLADSVEISDRYFLGTTLRLRRMQSGSPPATVTTVCKLGQKVRPDPDRPSLVHLTNLYLNEAEYGLLAQLDAAALSKVRSHWTVDGTVFAVDEFAGSLRGLVLAEVELAPPTDAPPHPEDAGPTLSAHPLAAADVTEDDRFSGGRLAALDPAGAAALLAEVAATCRG